MVAAMLFAVFALVSCAGASAEVPPAGPTEAPVPGIPAGGRPAADFVLRDQFGRSVRLSSFRGKVVLLSFIDNHCTTVCPLTAALMRGAEEAVGGSPPVQLIAINANPRFTSVASGLRWSRQHRMTNRWLFLTAPAARLRTVWSDYGIRSAIVNGDDEHTSVVFVIDPQGRIRTVFPIARRSGIDDEAGALAQAIRQVASPTQG